LAHDGSPSHNEKNEDTDEATVSHENDFIKAHTIFKDKKIWSGGPFFHNDNSAATADSMAQAGPESFLFSPSIFWD
jgi:hypothetical protein